MRNTGCSTVTNHSATELHVVDGEDPGRHLVVPPGGERDFGGTLFPWCIDAAEIARKAFRFHRGVRGPIAFYVFQRFRDQTVYWTAGNCGAPSWDAAVPLADPCALLSLTIGHDGRPAAEPWPRRPSHWPLPVGA